MFFVEIYFWWHVWRVKNPRLKAYKHRVNNTKNCNVIYRYLPIKLIWCLLIVLYLQNDAIIKWTTHFIRLNGWIPLKYVSTTTQPIIAHCQKTWMSSLLFHIAITNLQYKTHPEFWPSHRRIFKTRLYYKTCLISENWRYIMQVIQAWIFNKTAIMWYLLPCLPHSIYNSKILLVLILNAYKL